MSELLVNRESILAAMKRRIVRADIENFGTVCIRSLTGGQRARLGDLFKTSQDRTIEESQREYQARIVSLVWVNEDGDRIFTESADDLKTISDMDAKVLDEITQAGMKASGFNPESVKEAAKNSLPVPTDLQPST